ncbi:LOW QUALITY PROTEIN: rho GTPase-activating protein 30 [Cottoperca gobio]|uniref:LOW QUALITY PROTEIN: rho GTPase-activating protein 30 n=1 Tax=Cottoperca gobio TaxID=56716 RepID=A0A6J2RGV5_COTGO|nr:LOW QUALITY PROTEIN: rho GTPase-activating protein 30-like [Cottoperca gobio]
MRKIRRKGGNKDKVFGCDLLDHLTASCQEIPQVLQYCSEFVEKNGVVDGIYRLSGVSSNIQKLRGEFESDGNPDLNKDLYLQDIHCISSLCKAYFRELPNPLLTYQLYDKFAEAVAIQLEEERLVKIRDVLKELPAPHYRTLEFLMRHLVKMASYCSETNMHCRNLAIVWAPNLLRSKDIETSGFNGTAAFMEVRVQSIVVEFILTHVPQLFPDQGGSGERRKSLPSPSAIPNHSQEEGFQHVPHFGSICPGDGPQPIIPYHAIIEGTDKRKGSLKGRRWMSIFNIGGRFPDPRRRHKHSTKEKESPTLRPARSMDSLSISPGPSEGSVRSAQRLPSTSVSPLVTPSPHSGAELTASAGAIGGSEYAVTYRRGTGLVSGGAGTQGTYTSLDPEGVTGSETLQSRSPGLTTKVGRRAAMHITGPTMVTVPLHITSNLALGVLQGGGGDRLIHRRDKDGGDRVEAKEGGEKVERRESRVMDRKVEASKKVEAKEERKHSGNVADGGEVVDAEVNTVAGGCVEEEGEGKKEEEEEEVREVCRWKLVVARRAASTEQRDKSLTSDAEEDNADDDEYMDMKGATPTDCEPEATQRADDCVFDDSDVLNSTEVEEDDQEMSGYVQDNFEFLDQMDLDHMDCSVSYQVNEFSVEPPGHSDDEYEVMEQAHPAELQTDLQPGPATQTQSQLNPHRPLSLDLHNRHTKSLSLPYLTSPILVSEDSCSEEEAAADDSDDNDYSSDDDENMFVKSLPADFFLNNLPFETITDTQRGCTLDGARRSQSSENGPLGFSACEDSTAGAVEQVDGKDEGKEITQKDEEDHRGRERLENNRQSEATEEDVMKDTESDKEQPLTAEALTHCCFDFPPPSDDDSCDVADMKVGEEADMFDDLPSDYPPCHEVPCATQKETDDVSSEEFRDISARATEQPTKERDRDEGEDREVCKETEDTCIKERDENMWEETTEEGNEVMAEEAHREQTQRGGGEQKSAICETSRDIWVELEDGSCEVIEDEEGKQAEKKDASDGVAGEGDAMEDVEVGKEEEQVAKISGEQMVEVDKGNTNETEVRVEVLEATEGKLTDPERRQEFEEKETNLPKTSELEEATQGKHAVNTKAQHHEREEEASGEKEKENTDKERADERRQAQPGADKQREEVRCERDESKEGSGQGGVGRKLVTSKHLRVYQVRAVPVVPPKPQHCKITALSIRQHQQQRERRDADRGGGDTPRVPTEQDVVHAGDGEREKRRDGDESATRDTSRNSPISMCFDEAVAIATLRRGKEKDCEKEKERQRDRGNEVQ